MASESIHDMAFKLAVDSTGVATGMKAATAVILQAQRDQAKADQIEREINLQQKIDAEEKFNKWYMSELDREFQAWYKVELQKETAAEEAAAERTRIAAEAAAAQQQISINTYNAAISNERRLTTAVEEETQRQLAFSRQLQEAVIARYAAQDAAEEAAANKADTETQAIMDNAWTRIVNQQRATLAAFYAEKDRMAAESAAHTLRVTEQERKYQEQQDAERIRALREGIQASYAHLAERERQIELEGEHYAEMQDRRVAAAYRAQKRIEEDAARFRAGARTDMPAAMTATNISPATLRMVREFVAEETRANNLREDAVALIRQLATAQDMHNERVAEYGRMLAIGALNQDQYNAAIARSTQIMNASAGGFGGAGAAITQASYAAEDFIQVLSMGGGLNMALMSASNNLSMVARSVMGTSAAMGALAGFGVPAVLIGLGMLVRYMTDTENATDKATEALERFRKETENIGKMTRLNQQAAAEARDIQAMTSVEEVERKIAALKQEQLDLDQQMAQEEVKRAAANQIIFDEMLGGQKAIIEFQKLIDRAKASDFDFAREAATKLEQDLAQARSAAIAGNEQEMFASLRRIYALKGDLFDVKSPIPGIEGIDFTLLDSFKAFYNDPALVDSLQQLFDPNLTDLEENLKMQQEIADELLSQQEHMTEERKRQLVIAQNLLEAQEHTLYLEKQAAGEAQRSRQQRMREELDFMRMSEAEREMKRLRDEQAAFAGIDTAFVGPQKPVSESEFLQAFMKAQLEQVQKEIEQIKKPSFAAGTEQNAFAAQAKAFEQVLKSEFDKKDTQVERLDTLIEVERQLLQAIENNGFVRVIP